MNRVGIIGGGPAGIFCAIIIKSFNPYIDVVVFEKNKILNTILYTGNGRCNITHKPCDIRDFAQNYPRGEKFLYSVFNIFSPSDTIKFFDKIGIKTYTQSDNRVFPKSDSAKDVRETLIKQLNEKNIVVQNSEIKNVEYKNDKFFVDNEEFDKIVIATGGWNNLDFLKNFDIKINDFMPSLCSVEIKEKIYSQLSGVTLSKINAKIKYQNKTIKLTDDILFTHQGLSGPMVYKISSIFSREPYSNDNPIKLYLNFIDENFELQKLFNENSKKQILTLLQNFMPKSLAKLILSTNNIDFEKRACEITKQERKIIHCYLSEFELNITKPLKNGEIVHSGGIDLNTINPKTMESKIVKGLYFCGEAVDIDGFCGGFNLQNCWSTAFVAGKDIAK